jgi:hypothetical protein
MRWLVSLCALAVALGACGGNEDDDGAEGPETLLQIDVKLEPGSDTSTQLLECDPAGGDVADPEAACRRLAELESPFAPTPPDTACTEIYGGPQTATITGVLRGETVNASFSRKNGCEIARWDKLRFLLPAGGVKGLA